MSRNPNISFAEPQPGQYQRFNSSQSISSQDSKSASNAPALPPKRGDSKDALSTTKPGLHSTFSQTSGLSVEPSLSYGSHQNLMGVAAGGGGGGDGGGPGHQQHRGGITGFLGMGQPGGIGGGAADSLSPSAAYNYGNQQQQGQVASAAQQGGADFKRKKSLVKPDRERIDPNHRLWHYREHAAALVADTEAAQQQQQQRQQQQGARGVGGGVGGGARGAGNNNPGGIRGNNLSVLPSTTGNAPIGASAPQLRRGKSMLGREPTDTANESGLNFLKRGATLRRKNTANGSSVSLTGAGGAGGGGRAPNASNTASTKSKGRRNENERAWGCWGCLGNFAPGPKDAWMVYCYLLTICVPGFVLRGVFGKRSPDAQRAWREKIGIVSINASLMAIVGFITFGFTATVCNSTGVTIKGGHANSGSLVINGYDYDLSSWKHPAAGTYFNGSTNPIYAEPYVAGGKDASFLFQTINGNCLNVITPAANTAINHEGNSMAYYFPCNLHDQNGTTTVNQTGYESATYCHASNAARSNFNALAPTGSIYYTWDQVGNSSRNLAVFESNVLDLDLLQWLSKTEVSYPALFDQIKNKNSTYTGKDITMLMYRSGNQKIGKCLSDVIRVGFVDSKSIGCVASDVVLYVSLVFILGLVGIRFGMAVIFGWFLSWRLGNWEGESYKQRMARAAEVEEWTDDIYRPAPSRYRPSVAPGKGATGGGGKKGAAFLPTTSRYSQAPTMLVNNSRPGTAYGNVGGSEVGGYRARQTSSTYGGGYPKTTPPGSPQLRNSRSSVSLPLGSRDESRFSLADQAQSNCPFPLYNVIPQPPANYEPFNFPLVHSFCLVTAYSESIEGLRTTLDSLATTDYPNSHKVILVVADGMVKGSGSKLKTPDIVLGMMKDLVIPEQEVEAHSYVAIADGHKRHNMAKIYAGFYDYDNATVETSKQQKVPIILVAKVGNPLEAHDAKPGNRGKRDSQIVLMAFLQKVMFDERMTTFEYEFFNSLWRVTGVSPDRYETVLCVDADTKVFPDSLTRMNACMVHDQEIMGLCGETKIANKTETWVTMIQVFEYYVSHHSSKAFESVFGGVTCLPGCFSMYRIKAPKGDTGYWVPILANPDIVEHYSENIVDTLHKKNLYLLGEDRYLTTLMLKTFPKRKMVFVPQAVCKTVVPDTFRVLLSQRRRWINSTVHNLFELVMVRDLCGTFCFSMQFVVFMELVGTMVLPAAIAFTLYIIIDSIIPGTQKPIISLILLAFILGLPGLLIVITSRKIAFVGWMLIYLLSLPIWNFVLPMYAFWHMDDFSWGSTRVVEGEGSTDKGHGDKDGMFDASSIVMKRWVEFERERRWKSGTHSRDSYYDVVQRSSSPQRMTRDRYSMVSTNETGYTTQNSQPSDSPFYRPSQSFASMDVTSPMLEPPPGQGPFRGGRDGSPASSESAEHSGNYLDYSPNNYAREEKQPILDAAYPVQRPGFSGPNVQSVQGQKYASPTENPYQTKMASAASGYDMPSYSDLKTASQRDIVSPSVSRHRLTDSGPAQGAEPVRRVPRSASKRASFSSSGGHNSQGGHTPRSNGTSPIPPQQPVSSLPPGAAPAQTGRYY